MSGAMNNPAGLALQPAILAAAPRCGARTRAGGACLSPAIRGRRRCRMHGGKGSGAPRGNRNAWKHGLRSARFREIARYLRATQAGRLFAGPPPVFWARSPARAGLPARPFRAAAPVAADTKNKKTNERPHAPGKPAIPRGMRDVSLGGEIGAPGTKGWGAPFLS